MLCKFCQSLLPHTPSMRDGEFAIVEMSWVALWESAMHENCFLCSFINENIRDPKSGLHQIHNELFAARRERRPPRTLVFGYGVTIDRRRIKEGASSG